jgi:predicted dehydrogenase/nucleoside-diphosphate-sugar epimerase
MKLAVVGTGAIFQALHGPAIASIHDVDVSWLVDRSPRNQQAAQAMFPGAKLAADISEVRDVDMVLIATPNSLHYEQAKYALSQGWHAFIEKPLALTRAQADELVKLAAEKKLSVSVNVNRRFLPNVVELKRIIDSGELGAVRRIAVHDGVRSGGTAEGGLHYQGSAELAGGGVLIDTGSHMLDLALYLANATAIDELKYFDDGAATGIEAECRFELSAATPNGPTRIDGFLSRLSALPQRVEVELDEATIEVPLAPPSNPIIRFRGKSSLRTEVPVHIPADVFVRSFADSFRSFHEAAKNGGEGAINSGKSVALTVEGIERCYATRRPLSYPWVQPFQGTSPVKGLKVGVIGAGGFLGTRVFEILADRGAEPRPLTHSTHGSFSLLRHTGDVHVGDAADEAFLENALRGCDVVVNTAINMKGSRSFAIAATRGIARAVARVCGRVGVKRLVHISTLAVHGIYLGRRGEQLRDDPFRSTYSVAKSESEQDVLDECRRNGVGAVILRMGHIYGPYSVGWTAAALDMAKTGGLVSVERWANPSNTVFVDNAVEAILTAMTTPGVNGSTFYITDVPNQSWRQFYEPLFEFAGASIDAVPDLSFDEFRAVFDQFSRGAASQIASIGTTLIRKAISADSLKSIKRDLRFRRAFDVLETVVPSKTLSKLQDRIKKQRAPAAATSATGIDYGPLFPLLCSFASSIELPVSDSVERLQYQPAANRDQAVQATREWLRFID